MKIYVVTHKEFKNVVEDAIYTPLLVGADSNNGPSHYLRDNDGSNHISDYNYSFCELTGLYWMNQYSDSEVIGLNHYRRYFLNKDVKLFKKNHILSESQIKDLLQHHDIILPIKEEDTFEGMTAKDNFAYKHDVDVWEKCRAFIAELNPDYLVDFDEFGQQTTAYICNMFVAKKEIITSYCDWLFPILFKLHDSIDYDKYDAYNKRMIGFVGERLFNVWINHQRRNGQLSVAERPIYLTDSKLKQYYLYYKRQLVNQFSRKK